MPSGRNKKNIIIIIVYLSSEHAPRAQNSSSGKRKDGTPL
jgi:hypothetical protein